MNDAELQKKYYRNTCETLKRVELPMAALHCTNLKCNNESHRKDLTAFYNLILDALIKSGLHLSKNSDKNYTQRPGWTTYVSELYDYSKTCRQHWLDANEPRQGFIHTNYTKSRLKFKYALRFITKNDDQMRKEVLAKKQSDKKIREFWKEVSVTNNCKNPPTG